MSLMRSALCLSLDLCANWQDQVRVVGKRSVKKEKKNKSFFNWTYTFLCRKVRFCFFLFRKICYQMLFRCFLHLIVIAHIFTLNLNYVRANAFFCLSLSLCSAFFVVVSSFLFHRCTYELRLITRTTATRNALTRLSFHMESQQIGFLFIFFPSASLSFSCLHRCTKAANESEKKNNQIPLSFPYYELINSWAVNE